MVLLFREGRLRGTSFPSEKSWSAGSMAAGGPSRRRNSKSGSGSMSRVGSDDLDSDGSLSLLLKERRGLSQPP